MKLEFSRNILKKFHENPFIGSRLVPCGWKEGRKDGQTHRHDEADSCHSQSCERARKIANAPESYRRVKRIDELRRHIPALYS
jgi:hypothetical protein